MRLDWISALFSADPYSFAALLMALLPNFSTFDLHDWDERDGNPEARHIFEAFALPSLVRIRDLGIVGRYSVTFADLWDLLQLKSLRSVTVRNLSLLDPTIDATRSHITHIDHLTVHNALCCEI